MLTSDTPEPELTRRLTLEAANDGEALIAAARAAFCLLVLGRFLIVQHNDPDPIDLRAGLEIPLLSAVVIISMYEFRRARRHRLSSRALVLWSVADALVCFASLLSSVLWPSTLYRGLLRTPDVAVFLPLVFVSALRLTPAATLASLCANLAAMTALVVLDLHLNLPNITYGGTEITMLAILILTVGATAWQVTRGARELVRRTGHESAKLGRARRHLDAILREHHDVRTLLSTARINLQLAQQEPIVDRAQLVLVDQAIVDLSAFVEGVKNQAYAELAALDGSGIAAVADALRVAAAVAQRRFPHAGIEVTRSPPAHVRIAGGERALTLAVFNLLVNACEGDGARRATHILIDTAIDDSAWTLSVRDDGPGFPPELLAGGARHVASAKPGGSGFGLALVSELMEASGGRLHLCNPPEGGARATLQLPLA